MNIENRRMTAVADGVAAGGRFGEMTTA